MTRAERKGKKRASIERRGDGLVESRNKREEKERKKNKEERGEDLVVFLDLSWLSLSIGLLLGRGVLNSSCSLLRLHHEELLLADLALTALLLAHELLGLAGLLEVALDGKGSLRGQAPTAPGQIRVLVLVELTAGELNDAGQAGLVLSTDILEDEGSSGLFVDNLPEAGLALHNHVRHIHLAAEGRKPDNELLRKRKGKVSEGEGEGELRKRD